MFLKFAKADVLGLKSSSSQIHEASLSKFADYEEYRTDDDYVYVRVRAISSRVNKNHDGWPADELQKSYKTFIGKPIFVDHHNDDPKAARGVIVDAALHVEDLEKVSSTDPYYASAPDEHKPPTWVELLLEVDAKSYPKLAKAIVDGDIDGVSMGCNVEKSKCSVCANWASSPEEYCSHIRSKGAYYDHKQVDGSKISKRSYEDCLIPGTLITMGDGSTRPIEKVLVDDEVLDHLGKARRVEKTYVRPENSHVFEIHRIGQGNGFPTTLTGNHPVLAVRSEGRNRKRVERALRNGSKWPEYINADQLQSGDWLAEIGIDHSPELIRISIPGHVRTVYGMRSTTKIDQTAHSLAITEITLDEDFGRWCGWYLAEGSILHNRLASGSRSVSGVIFALNRKELDEADEIAHLGQRLFGLKAVHHECENRRTVSFYSQHLGQFMQQLGVNSYEKALPAEWLKAPIPFINGVIAAHHAGDNADMGDRPERRHITSSKTLADQLYQMNIWLGRTPSRHRDLPTKQNKRTTDGLLVTWTDPQVRQRATRGRMDFGPWTLSRVSKIEQSEYNGPVHNLHVADTHTYVANGHAVHNCYDIGFFEISFVFDPADETALVRDIRTSKVRNEVRNEYVATDGLYDYEADGFGADLSNVSPGLLQLATSAFEDGMARGGDEGSAWRFANQTLANAGYDPMQINAALTKVTEQFQGLIQHFQDNSDSIGQDQPYEGMPKPQSLPVFNDLEGQSPWNNPTLSRKTAEYHYVKKHGDKWVIIQKGTGKVLSTHDSEGQAKASFRAMETHKHEGATYLADRESPLPQSELIVAPTKVDTLRQEQTCPICGSVMDDGMCGVCNYEEPPEGFDNPDLQKARELDDQEKQQVGQPQPEQEQNQQAPPTGGPTGGLPPGVVGPSAQAGMGMAASTNKNRPAQAVTSDMSDWRVTLQSRTAGNNTSGGRINTQERPILPVTRQNSDKPLNPKVISDSRKPVESKTKENQLSRTRKVADGATPWGSGTSADERVDVTGIGAVDDSPEKDTRHENVEKAMSQEAGPHTDTWNGNEGDSLGQHDPVTDVASDDVVGGPIGKPVATAGIHTSLLPAHEADGTWGDPGEGSGKAFPDHEPTRIDVAAPLLEEVGDPTKTFGGDDFHLTNPITDQDSNEVGGPMGDPLSQEPAAKSSSVKAHIFRAIRLADAEVELGLTEKAEKWNRADELESQSPDALDAVEAMVKKVANSETIRTARTSASRMPSLQRTASIDPIEHAVTDTGGAEGLFL